MHALLHEMSIYQLFVSIKFDSLKKSLVSCITCTCEWLKIYEDAIVCSICTINKEEQEGEKKKGYSPYYSKIVDTPLEKCDLCW